MKSIVAYTLILFLLSGCQSADEAMPSIASSTPTAVLPTDHPTPTTCENGITAVGTMQTPRSAHTATLLTDGTILLTGGFNKGENGMSSAELFDPLTQAFHTTAVLSVPRQSHTATLLPNGLVLIAGGFNGDYLASAELYNPQTGAFTATGSMTEGRSGHTAVLLTNGTVLIVGGTGKGWSFLDTAELYEPQTGTFSATGRMRSPRESHTATLLANGQVLITGGHQGRRANIIIYDSAELYDPASGTFSPTASMHTRRHKHDATLLTDGRVLITGGSDERDADGVYNHAELYDPILGQFVETGMMANGRYKHTNTTHQLPNGSVLIVGGASQPEQFHSDTGQFTSLAMGPLPALYFATATPVNNGQILLAGGYGQGVNSNDQAWLIGVCVEQ